jgi:hypothetical protein
MPLINMRRGFFVTILMTWTMMVIGQHRGYWQQKANYKLDIDFDDKKHQYKGVQTITFTNNSEDNLTEAYFHLYFNAFQPGSEMDVRSRTIPDPDRRVGDRIAALNQDEIGFLKVSYVKIKGKSQEIKEQGTILEVKLDKPIKPGETVKIDLEFNGQVPIQIRRSGRNSSEGIDYSMAQWYPKLCNYDNDGWHPNPYVAREFYGIWGDWDVKINMDEKYTIGATGVVQNPDQVGHGYSNKQPVATNGKIKWHFKAINVHDFVWGADPDYKHVIHKAHDGTEMHFFYQPGPKTESWESLPKIMDEALRWMNKRYGKYAFPAYSFIQGGDGGMEYPMATLITGERSLPSLVGVSVHEWMHSWYQMVLATNEALYAWMDEGFTSFASTETMNYLRSKKMIPGTEEEMPFKREIAGFVKFAVSDNAEPLTTHSDHFNTNAGYGTSSYTKGSLALVQLNYILGNKTFEKALLKYYDTWKFKHPDPKKFVRVFEKESGMVLDWFLEYWVNTTHIIDYSVDTIENGKVTLSRLGRIPMPLDVIVTTKDNKKHLFYIPLSLMRAEKVPDLTRDAYNQASDWDWTNPSYILDLKIPTENIVSIEIDPSLRMADADRSNNIYSSKTSSQN